MTAILKFEESVASIQRKLDRIRESPDPARLPLLEALERELASRLGPIYRALSPMQCAMVARHPARPDTKDYLKRIFDEFVEFHGDRRGGDDAALVGGVGRFNGEPCVVVGHQKGADTKQKLMCNFGMARPAGYRKAARLYELAGEQNLPIVTFVDTPGAFPGVDAEEQGQSEALATCIRRLVTSPVPVIAVVTGEGGSGGALALSVADRVGMLSYSVYSVISPEGCAAILWKSAERVASAASVLGIDAKSVLKVGLVDEVIAEPVGGAHRFPSEAANAVKQFIDASLKQLQPLSAAALRNLRQTRLFSHDRNLAPQLAGAD